MADHGKRTTLSEHELAKALSVILDRANHGERFIIERNGQQIAVLSLPAVETVPVTTDQDLVDLLGDVHMPGEGFADDIEAARASLLPPRIPCQFARAAKTSVRVR
ncbi:MAG: hypothetical protein IT338_12950 [Thermomicrobiales bacterium]|nr:hypothetical protein [Thermomicrobiales bacterium]